MMSNTETLTDQVNGPNRLIIGGAGLLVLLSASCCVLPIGLSIIGLGGTWLTMLGAVRGLPRRNLYRGGASLGLGMAAALASMELCQPQAINAVDPRLHNTRFRPRCQFSSLGRRGCKDNACHL